MPKFRPLSFLQSSSSNNSPPKSSTTSNGEEKKQTRPSLSGTRQPKANNGESASNSASQRPSEDSSSTSRMIALARTISREADKLEAYMTANSLPEASFDVNAPGDFPALSMDAQKNRLEIISATKELNRLVMGPKETVRWGVWHFLDTLSLQVINNYGIAKLVPIDGAISLSELQSKTTLDPINLGRILRHAMTNFVFRESSPGMIAHTAASRMLADDVALRDWVGFNSEDMFPAGANVLKALKAYPEATNVTQSGFNFAFDTVDKEPIFVTLGKEPERARRMGGAMASLTGGEGYEVKYFVDNYDLSNVNDTKGTFVDIGGSHGFVSVDLAKKWNKINFVVQDLPKTVDSAPNPISEDTTVAARIQLQPHDFFTEQPVKDADVYYFRWIIHNYSTPYAVKILKSLVPALKPGARIVINDHCLREPGSENAWDESLMRGMDLVMLLALNAQERDEDEFRELFKMADERYTFKSVTRVSGCRMAVVEAIWEPEKISDAQ